jgi:hypothetical protein
VAQGSVLTSARLCVSAFGVAAGLWAFLVMPRFWTEAAAYQASSRILAGDVYSQESLAVLAASLAIDGTSGMHPASLGPKSIIQLRQTEEAIAQGEQGIFNSRLMMLDRTLIETLINTPEASYQWLALYWTENRLNGYDPRFLDYLRMSYAVGPQEGWVALKRNRIVLGLFAVLTQDLKDAALSEFVGLVRSKFYADAAEIVGSSTPVVREKLIAQLDRLKESDRLAFTKILYDKWLLDKSVGGENSMQFRPWR